jgi:hypothetical protein
MLEMVAKWEVVGKVVSQFTLMVADKYQVAMKVVVEFSGPMEARVGENFILEMVEKCEVVGHVGGQFTLMVGEKCKVGMKVVAEFSGPVGARVGGKFISEMMEKWEEGDSMWQQNCHKV